jgi:hypothetical protein
MRDAAFALFLEAYRHVRHGVMLLRWAENDAGAFLPALSRRKPWMLGGSRSERDRERSIASNPNDGTVRLEAAMASPIRHREVPMG